jgi:hypothetical protein
MGSLTSSWTEFNLSKTRWWEWWDPSRTRYLNIFLLSFFL